MWTTLSLLTWTTDYFQKNLVLTPRLDAELLLSHLLKIERLQLYLKFDRPMSEEELAAFKALIQRRIKGEPVSYIRNVKEFWSLSFKVGPGVLVPRPDTEILLERVKEIFREKENPLNILDIGTGSGNLAIALAKEFPKSKITAMDISFDALKYARENAELNGVDSQIEFIQKDFLTSSNLRTTIYDLIVSNPPYISSSVIETLDPGIQKYEPRIALDGGPDGLDFYREIGESAPLLLKKGGVLIVEIGEDQGDTVKEIFSKAELNGLQIFKDYAGLSRVVVGRKNG